MGRNRDIKPTLVKDIIRLIYPERTVIKKFPAGAMLATKRYYKKIESKYKEQGGLALKYRHPWCKKEYKLFICQAITYQVYRAIPEKGCLKLFKVRNGIWGVDDEIMSEVTRALLTAFLISGTTDLTKKQLKKLGV